MKDCGVLYFLTAKDERSEPKVMKVHGSLLFRSLESLNKHMPDIKTVLFTNIDSVDWEGKGFDIVEKRYHPADVWSYKYECLLDTPFLKTIHMDCDTYVCGEFYEVFHMLDNVDFAAPFSPWYFTRKQFNVPKSFPELAGGFVAYNTNDKVYDLLKYAKKLIMERHRGCDEPYLRIALYEKNVKFSILPWEYNCVVLLPGFIMSRVKVIHGKIPDDDIEAIERSLFGEHPKLFTGENIIHCDRLGRKKYKMGLVEKRGHSYE
jgi:hypothetical protein